MENIREKASFLKQDYTEVLSKLSADTPHKWGKMNVQQMVEHMSDYVRIASGKTPMDIITEADKLPRAQGFLTSEKTFPENTPNVLMPDTPPLERHSNLAEAITELQQELDYFFAAYHADPEKTVDNPFFGSLNFDMQVQLLYKHSTHHLKQFGAGV